MDYYATHIKPRPKLPKFDLKVGDVVKTYEVYEYKDYGTSARVSKVEHYYTVTHISTHIFVCEDRLGIKVTFMKKQYQLGEVRKVK